MNITQSKTIQSVLVFVALLLGACSGGTSTFLAPANNATRLAYAVNSNDTSFSTYLADPTLCGDL